MGEGAECLLDGGRPASGRPGHLVRSVASPTGRAADVVAEILFPQRRRPSGSQPRGLSPNVRRALFYPCLKIRSEELGNTPKHSEEH